MSIPVEEVYAAIAPKINQTPLIPVPELSHTLSSEENGPPIDLFLKWEGAQKTGSFKYRGALSALSSLPTSTLTRGLVTTSSGNFGKALGTAARDLGHHRGIQIPLTVVMPSTSRVSKIIATKSLGVSVYLSGPSWADREEAVMALQKQLETTYLSTTNNVNIILGQGTVGVEMMHQLRRSYRSEFDAVIAPCGSGGLLAGIALCFHGSHTKVFGAEPSEGGADEVRRGRLQKARIGVVESSSIADGLRCPVSEAAWEIIKRPDYVEDVFAVSEQDIQMAMKTLSKHNGLLVEPSAAAALAAALFSTRFCEHVKDDGRRPYRVGVILTGGNINLQDFSMLVTSGE